MLLVAICYKWSSYAPTDDYQNKFANAYFIGNAIEHTHRKALQESVQSVAPGIVAINDPKRNHVWQPRQGHTVQEGSGVECAAGFLMERLVFPREIRAVSS
jgi:hypothetical protein